MGQANNNAYTLRQKLDFLIKNKASTGIGADDLHKIDAAHEYEINNRFDTLAAKIGPDPMAVAMADLYNGWSPDHKHGEQKSESPNGGLSPSNSGGGDSEPTIPTPSEDAAPVPSGDQPSDAEVGSLAVPAGESDGSQPASNVEPVQASETEQVAVAVAPDTQAILETPGTPIMGNN